MSTSRFLFWDVRQGGGDLKAFDALQCAIKALGHISESEVWSGQVAVQHPMAMRSAGSVPDGEPLDRQRGLDKRKELHVVTLSNIPRKIFLINR